MIASHMACNMLLMRSAGQRHNFRARGAVTGVPPACRRRRPTAAAAADNVNASPSAGTAASRETCFLVNYISRQVKEGMRERRFSSSCSKKRDKKEKGEGRTSCCCCCAHNRVLAKLACNMIIHNGTMMKLHILMQWT